MAELAPLGAPARVSVRRVDKPRFYVRFEYDGHELDFDEDGGSTPVPKRRVQTKTFLSEWAGYRWMARRLIFARRDKFQKVPFHKFNDATGEELNCTLCRHSSDRDGYPTGLCRYHDDDSFRRLEARLASWLRWRDSRLAP